MMATRSFIGTAPIRAQVDHLTPGGTIEAGDKFRVYIPDSSGKVVEVAAPDTTVAALTAALAVALAAEAAEEFREITWTDGTTHVVATANEAGKPFTLALETVESNNDPADAQTFTLTHPTPNSSPYDLGDSANWSGDTLPVDGDTIVFETPNVPVRWRLDALDDVTPAAVYVRPQCNGDLGLPNHNGQYQEYRPTAITFDGATLMIVDSPANLVRFAFEGAEAHVTVNGTGSSGDTPAMLLRDLGANSTVTVNRGNVGIAIYAGETATVDTLRVGYQQNVEGDARVQCGLGTTLDEVEKSGGSLTVQSATTVLTQTGGETTVAAGAHALIEALGGTVYYNSTGTLTTARVAPGATLDFGRDMRPKAVTNPIEVTGNGGVRDPNKVVAALVIDLNDTASLENSAMGTNIRVTRGTPS